MRQLLLPFVLFASLAAQAAPIDGPRIEPGPTVTLDETAQEAVQTLLYAKPADLAAFIKAGNRVTRITRRNWSPGVTYYTFERKICYSGGINGGHCDAGATLEITVTKTRTGSIVSTKAESRIISNGR